MNSSWKWKSPGSDTRYVLFQASSQVIGVMAEQRSPRPWVEMKGGVAWESTLGMVNGFIFSLEQ